MVSRYLKSKIFLFFPFLGFLFSGCIWTSISTLQTLKPGEKIFGIGLTPVIHAAGTYDERYNRSNAPSEVSILARCGILSLGKFGWIEGGLRGIGLGVGADLKWNITEEKKFLPSIALMSEYFTGGYVKNINFEGYTLKGGAGSLIFRKALSSKSNFFTGYKYVSTRVLNSTLVESAAHDGLFIAYELNGKKKNAGLIMGITYLKENKLEVFPYWLKEEKERTGYGILPREVMLFTVAGYFPFPFLKNK